MGKLVDVPNLAANAHYCSTTGVGEIRRTSIWGIIIIVFCIEILHASDIRATAGCWCQFSLNHGSEAGLDHRPPKTNAFGSHSITHTLACLQLLGCHDYHRLAQFIATMKYFIDSSDGGILY